MQIELNTSTDTDLIRMILSASDAAAMGVDDFVAKTLRAALVSQGVDHIVNLEDEVSAWEIIRGFGECPSYITDRNQVEFYRLLRWFRARWLEDDVRFKEFTVYQVGQILSKTWCHESRSGDSLSGEQTLAECWDMMGYDAHEFLYGDQGVFQDTSATILIQHLNEALSPTGSIACIGALLSFTQWGLK